MQIFATLDLSAPDFAGEHEIQITTGEQTLEAGSLKANLDVSFIDFYNDFLALNLAEPRLDCRANRVDIGGSTFCFCKKLATGLAECDIQTLADGNLGITLAKQETLWINATLRGNAAQVLAGSVNVLGGGADPLRHFPKQNFFAPQQDWIDGVVTNEGLRDFSALEDHSITLRVFKRKKDDVNIFLQGRELREPDPVYKVLSRAVDVTKSPREMGLSDQQTVSIQAKDKTQTINLDVHDDEPISQLSQQVASKIGRGFRMIFNGKELQRGCRISDYNILDNSTIHIVPGSVESPTHRLNEKPKLYRNKESLARFARRAEEVTIQLLTPQDYS